MKILIRFEKKFTYAIQHDKTIQNQMKNKDFDFLRFFFKHKKEGVKICTIPSVYCTSSNIKHIKNNLALLNF
jgi:hypothetical protein